MQQLTLVVERFFQRRGIFNYLLWPLSFLFIVIALLRRQIFQRLSKKNGTAVTVVVGNIAVGGSGKTPTLISLVRELSHRGYRVGVISRGYQGADNHRPQLVNASSLPSKVGDEPVLIAKAAACPVVICRDRAKAYDYLMQHSPCDVVLSDDGLQHYRLHRDIEIICINKHALGNRLCLPAGPLREPMKRLKTGDFILADEQDHKEATLKSLYINGIYQLKNDKLTSVEEISTKSIIAISAIAHPQRFYQSLSSLGLSFEEQTYPDHYQFNVADLNKRQDAVYIMTEKDAVKCRQFELDNLFYLKIDVCIPEAFLDRLEDRIKSAADSA